MSLARRDAGGIGIVALAALACVFALYVLYPGWYSFDSAALLAQAINHQYMNLQPPLTAAMWSVLLRLGLPPGSLVAANLVVLWLGVALLARALRHDAPVVAWVLPLLPLAPPLLVLMGHAWTDITMASLLVLAAGAIASMHAQGRRAWAIVAVVAMLVAAGIRHNAIFALPPLAWWLVRAWPRGEGGAASARIGRAPLVHAGSRRDSRRAPWRDLAAVAVLLVAAIGVGQLCDRLLTVQRTTNWTLTATWDVGAVSARIDRVLLPTRMHGAGMTAADLRAAVTPDTALELVLHDRTPIDAGILAPLPADVQVQLRNTWLSLPFTYPVAYFGHRFAVAWSLFGPQRDGKRVELYIVPRVVTIDGNPPIVANATSLNRALVDAAMTQRTGYAFAALPWLVAGALALLVAWRVPPSPAGAAVRAIATSGWLYALALVPITPAAEVRYAFWGMFAGGLALLLALPLPFTRGRRRDAVARGAPFTAGHAL